MLTPLAALGGGEASDPALPALERRKPAPSMAMLTPAFLCSCFCLGSRPDMRWGWPCALGSQGSAFCSHQKRLMCPSCEQGGGYQLHEGLSTMVGPFLSAGDVFQLPLPLCGAGLLPGPGAAASRSCRWHPAHVHAQGNGLGAPQPHWARSASCHVALREDLLRQALCQVPEGWTGGGAWALPSGFQREVQHINLGEIGRSFREEVTCDSSPGEQMGFQ